MTTTTNADPVAKLLAELAKSREAASNYIALSLRIALTKR